MNPDTIGEFLGVNWTEWEREKRVKDLRFLQKLAKFEEMRRDL